MLIVKPPSANKVLNQYGTLSGNTIGENTVSGTNIVFVGGSNVTLQGSNNSILFHAAAGGTGTSPGATYSFANSNGVTFGETGGTVTASVATNYQAPGDYLTTAALSDHGHTQYLTTAQPPGAYLTTAQPPGAYLTTAALSDHGHTQYLTTAALSSHTHSQYLTTAGGIAAAGGTQTQTSGTLVFANSNGLSFGMSGSSQITGSFASSQLAGGNGITVSSNGSTISIVAGNYLTTAAASDHAHTQYLTTAALSNHSHGNPTLYLTNLTGTTASASNGLSLSLSAASPGGGAGVTLGQWYDSPDGLVSSSGATNAQATWRRLQLPVAVSFTRVDVPIMVSIGSSAAANTANIVFTSRAGLYTRTGATFNPLVAYSGNTTYTWASNSANYSSIIGGRFASFPLQTTLSAGEYYFMVGLSTTNNSSIGTATTAIANTISVLFGSTYTALNFNQFGSTTAGSTTGLAYGQGLNSVLLTATSQTFQGSQISMSGAPGARANVHVIFRGN